VSRAFFSIVRNWFASFTVDEPLVGVNFLE